MDLLKIWIFSCLFILATSKYQSSNSESLSSSSSDQAINVNKPIRNLEVSGNKLKKSKRSCLAQISGDYCFTSLTGPLIKELGVTPTDPKEMDVKLLLFTCKNKDKSQNFTYLSETNEWKNSNFNNTVNTRFIVHGHNEKYPGNSAGYNWMEQMKNLILEKSCDNVVAIDWSKPASSPIYYPSAVNTRVVGKMIGCVINRWKDELDYSPENVHLIGHSLGGQVVGFAGKEVKHPKVRQITGLDPAGPGFQEFGDDSKLAVTDGQCVNVIHTNGARTIPIIDGLGHLDPMGHIDFYPNGGHQQKGCSLIEEIATDPTELPDPELCSHVRSNKYAIADQNYTDGQKCEIIGYRCKSYDEFKHGKCGADCRDDGSGCKLMPLDLDYWDDPKNCKVNGVHIEYYLNTGNVENQEQYCLYHYQIIVNINSIINPCFGVLSIKLSNGKQIGVKLGLKNILDLNIGNKKYSKLFTDSEELGDFTGAEIKPILGLTCSINKIEFNYMTSLDASIRKQKSRILCSTDGKTFSTNC